MTHITFRFFIASEAGLEPVSQARWNRLMAGDEAVPYHDHCEAKTLEVSMAVEGHVIQRVLRVLPVRVPVDEEGRMNTGVLVERAMSRLPSFTVPPTMATVIAGLQQDASYFWPLEGRHWQRMSQLLDVPITELKRALHRSLRR
jgi:hypothetical protein